MQNKMILEIKNLKTYFHTMEGTAKAVDGIDLSINSGEVLGIVGESGCGKSVTALSILRLIPEPPGKIVDGEILFKGRELLNLSEAEMRRIRGNSISMIFQEPMTSLNPVFKIGDQIAEAIILHQKLSKSEAWEKAVEFLKIVGIPSPHSRAKDYPHQLSGGMRQRVMIAMAFSCEPELLIADEPTTALDVTIQAQILDLMKQMKEKMNSSVMLITHDLGIIAENAQRVLVMYGGQSVESADVSELFNNPLHPYTNGLLNSIPRRKKDKKNRLLLSIPGIVPSLFNISQGCRFVERCVKAKEICSENEPPLIEKAPGHWVRCWREHE